jgi:hypothetical protein
MEAIDLLALCFLAAGLVFGIGACWAPAGRRLRDTISNTASDREENGRAA